MYFDYERAIKIAEELKANIYEHKAPIDSFKFAEGNFKHISEASQHTQWQDFTSYDRWGKRDGHYWFKTTVEIPEALDGKKVVLLIYTNNEGWDATNPQFLLYIDQKVVQGLDVNHREALISMEPVKNGMRFDIDLDAYSGMIEAKSQLYMELAAVNKDVRRLYYNIMNPLWVVEKLDPNDKNRIDMLTIINDTINLLDLRKIGSKEYYQSIDAANDYIEDTFYKDYCGHDDTIATCIGHTHIDVAWLWTIAQTREKSARSFSTVLRLMEEYPEYEFMSSQPRLYKNVKEDHPEVYEKIKQRVKENRWEPEGAMWVEPDCNVPSGESLVRQLLFGRRFFKEEFDVDCKILWLPDVFGYNAQLPQILKRSGVDYFMTIKIGWNQFNKLPYDTFDWEGIDGSKVFAHLITMQDPYQEKRRHDTTYNGLLYPGAVMKAWDRYQQKALNEDILVSFGYGDGGGGPSREMLENARRLNAGIPGCPKVEIGKSKPYFDRLHEKVKDNKYLPTWVGELYLEYHRGTYTSMGKNKRYNRKCELLYQDLEFFSVWASKYGYVYPQDRINRNWETILTNQFHDILPGSSIKEVYDDSTRDYEEVIQEGTAMLDGALDALASHVEAKEGSLVVFNTLSTERNDMVIFDIPEGMANPCVMDNDGELIPCQVVHDGKAIFFAKGIPSKGYKTYSIVEEHVHSDGIIVESNKMENAFYDIELNDEGNMVSIYDKKHDRQVLKNSALGNELQAFEDKPMKFDNWDIDIYYQEKMWSVNDVSSVQVVECGPVRGALRIEKTFMDSTIVQTIYIYKDIPRIDFDTYVDWKEHQVLLKAAFPVDVHNDKATYDIQFGNVERPTHWNTSWDLGKFEVCGHKWADLSEGNYGVSLMNDCKYGHDIKDGTMRLTLIKSGVEPFPEADQEEHFFTYSLYPHAGTWREANTPKMAYQLNVHLYAVVAKGKSEECIDAASYASVDQANVVLETIKKAEADDAVILRLYENQNSRTKVTVTLGDAFNKVYECDLMEEVERDIPFSGKQFTVEISPYEIKTIKVC